MGRGDAPRTTRIAIRSLAGHPYSSSVRHHDLLMFRLHPPSTDKVRPDFKAAWSRGSSESKKAFLCPAINMEDLMKDSNLLEFIRSRALHPPWTFARHDYEAAKLGVTTKQTTQFGLVGHPGLVMFLEIDTFEILQGAEIVPALMDIADPFFMYGKVIPRSLLRQSLVEFVADEENRCRIENSYWTTQPGLICLRSQKETYSFLCGCCELLRKRKRTSIVPRSLAALTPLSRLRNTQGERQEEDLWSSLLAKAPYRAPQRPDFALLIDFVDSKCAYTENHILELRRSPLHFAEALAQYVSNDSRAPSKVSKPSLELPMI